MKHKEENVDKRKMKTTKKEKRWKKVTEISEFLKNEKDKTTREELGNEEKKQEEIKHEDVKQDEVKTRNPFCEILRICFYSCQV